MAKKFYAVRKGKVVGIFTDWASCKDSIDGYSGAKYKGFMTQAEAEAYLMGEETVELDAAAEVVVPNPPPGSAVAYVDGSYKADTKEFSYGAVLFANGEMLEFSGAYDNPTVSSMRNVAGELKGAMEMIAYCAKNGISNLEIHHDYTGIEKWYTGKWRTNEVGTKMYKEYCNRMKLKVNVTFVKVKGHSGDTYNDRADALAKAALGIE